MSVFKRKRNGAEETTYTIKFEWQGEQKWIKSGLSVKEEAERMERDIKRELRAGRIPALLAQLKQRQEITCGCLITAYLADGAPDRKLRPRAGDALDTQKDLLVAVRKHWAGKNPNLITQADCDEYWKHRRATVTRGTGDRTTEIELTALSNVLTWATRVRRIEFNRIARRPTYRDPDKIVHCRDRMPLSADELHTIAGALLRERRSEACGWQLLLEAFTGMRTEEVQRLRADAKRIGTICQPGYQDDKLLYIQRVKRGVNPQIRLDDPARPQITLLLEKIRAWKADRYSKSVWLLPGKGGENPVGDGALTHALNDLCKKLQLPHRTSHGMRAYYCTARRCQGIDDSQIAWEMGQGSGPDLIRKVYGEVPANWQGLANTFTWLPTAAVKPAWQVWEEAYATETQPNVIHLELAAA